MSTTNVYNNMASLGKSISACNSEVVTALSYTSTDHTCTNYDTNINRHFVPAFEERDLSKITHLNKDAPCIRLTKADDTFVSELRKTSAASYTALSFSITLFVGLLLYVVITKAVQQCIRYRARPINTDEPPHQIETEPVYEETQVHTVEGDVSDIEMERNVVYGQQSTATTT